MFQDWYYARWRDFRVGLSRLQRGTRTHQMQLKLVNQHILLFLLTKYCAFYNWMLRKSAGTWFVCRKGKWIPWPNMPFRPFRCRLGVIILSLVPSLKWYQAFADNLPYTSAPCNKRTGRQAVVRKIYRQLAPSHKIYETEPSFLRLVAKRYAISNECRSSFETYRSRTDFWNPTRLLGKVYTC